MPSMAVKISMPSINAAKGGKSLERIAEMGPMEAVSQVVSGLGFLAGAALLKAAMESKPMAGGWPRCAKCNGTGRVACLCSRWSDGDVGCRACAGSGRAACNACGGSGTGRPVPVQLSMRGNPPPS
ncbi:chaperone protein dnaJ-like protein [Wolffia australiana]